MSIETKYVCDVCGAVRGETNHWFVGGTEDSNLQIWPFDSDPLYGGQQHLCGQKCAHAMLDRWLTTGSITAPSAPESQPPAER